MIQATEDDTLFRLAVEDQVDPTSVAAHWAVRRVASLPATPEPVLAVSLRQEGPVLTWQGALGRRVRRRQRRAAQLPDL